MTNKEYREAARAASENAEIYTFEHYGGGYWPSYYMTADDLREMRRAHKRDAEQLGAERIDTRAEIIPTAGVGRVLRSYYTDVAAITHDGHFVRLWDGFSVTTLKHVNIFRERAGMPSLSKREWIEMPVNV